MSPTRRSPARMLPAWSAPFILALVLAACSPPSPDAPEGSTSEGSSPETSASERSAPESPATVSAAIVFTDITAASGIDFVHENGASERRYLPETMGSGAAFFDADGDGDADLYLANGRSIADPASAPPPGAFYLNLGADQDGVPRFAEATRAAGFDVPFYGMGTAVGDVDNDGDLDLFVSGLGGDRFFRNLGTSGPPGRDAVPRFEEVSAELGLDDRGFGSSAAFLDYDRDGFLDLFVGRYVEWSRESDVECRPDGEHPSYCTPEVYRGASNLLYRNLGGARFADVAAVAGLAVPGKTLGVVPIDHDGDGWPDLAVANDTSPNALHLNLGAMGEARFRDAAVELGVAFSLSGATRGAMGIDAGDFDGDGREALVIGNFSHEMAALYRATEHGLYRDEAAQRGLGLPTLMYLTFGTLAADFDLDGRLDVALANGHIEPEASRFQRLQTYAQPLLVFRNAADGELVPVAPPPGSPLATPWVGRGLASADVDGDGDLDLLLTQNGRAARLLRNDSPPRRFLRVALVGRASNRTGYGAVVSVVTPGSRQTRRLVSGRSYLSASEPVLTFGLGDLERVDALEVRWPSGTLQRVERPELDRTWVIEEP